MVAFTVVVSSAANQLVKLLVARHTIQPLRFNVSLPIDYKTLLVFLVRRFIAIHGELVASTTTTKV